MISTFFRALVAAFARMIAFDLWRGRRAALPPRRGLNVQIIERSLRRGFESAANRRDWLLGFRSAVYALCGPNSPEYAAVNKVLEAVEAEEGKA